MTPDEAIIKELAMWRLALALESPRLRAPGTITTYLCRANMYLNWLDGRYPPTDDDTRLYISVKRQEGSVEGSLAAIFSALKKLHLSCHWKWEFTGDDRPLPSSEVNAPAFTEEELATLIHNREEYSRGETFYLALSTIFAPRREELSRVHKRDIKDEAIYIRTAKKGPPRWHLIPDEIMPIVNDYRPKELKPDALTKMFHRICIKGLGDSMKGYGWHSVRRSILTLGLINLAKADLPLTYWAEYMRWSRKAIGQVFMGSAMAGHYTHPEILAAGDPYSLDRKILELHPILHYWREE